MLVSLSLVVAGLALIWAGGLLPRDRQRFDGRN